MRAVSAFGGAVAQGLGASPKGLPPRYFYDERGSQLYEKITHLPEYYLTRSEAEILAQHSPSIVSKAGAFDYLVELGSGSATKTRFLLDAMRTLRAEAAYHPVDISETAIQSSVEALRAAYPGLEVVGHVGEYRRVLASLRDQTDRARFVVFLGSSIGNFSATESADFLSMLHDFMRHDEPFLIGMDRATKDVSVIEAAYNDAEGVTAEFNLNILARINRELGADFDLSSFRHRAFFNQDESRIEMHLESLQDQSVHVEALGQSFDFRKGETIHTENSYKYTDEMVAGMAQRGGFDVERTWLDSPGWFGLHLWRRRSSRPRSRG